MECFIQQVFSRHLLSAKQEEYNQESLSATLGKVLENSMEQWLVILALIRPTHTVLLNRGHGGYHTAPHFSDPNIPLHIGCPICLSFSLSPSSSFSFLSLFNQETFVGHPLYFRAKSVFQACWALNTEFEYQCRKNTQITSSHFICQ